MIINIIIFYKVFPDKISKIMNCFVCDKPTIKQCVKCAQIYYCSRECQLNNWQTHKKECLELQSGAPMLALIKSAIGDDINTAIYYGDIEIIITENWEEFSTSIYYPHFAHIKVVEIKHNSSYNICVIKFNDLSIKQYICINRNILKDKLDGDTSDKSMNSFNNSFNNRSNNNSNNKNNNSRSNRRFFYFHISLQFLGCRKAHHLSSFVFDWQNHNSVN